MNGLEAHLGQIGSLDLEGDTDQLVLQDGLGTSVHHLALDSRSLRCPVDKDDLVDITTFMAKVEVNDGVGTLVAWQGGDKVLEASILGTGLGQDDLLAGVVHLEDEELGRLAQLELVELGETFVVDFNSGGHCVCWLVWGVLYKGVWFLGFVCLGFVVLLLESFFFQLVGREVCVKIYSKSFWLAGVLAE